MSSKILEIFQENYLYIFLFHTIISTFISLFMVFYLSKRFKNKIDTMPKSKNFIVKLLHMASTHQSNKITIFLFFMLFNFTMPLVGYVFSFWLAYYFVHVKYIKKISDINILDLSEFEESFVAIQRVFGEGSMINLLNNPYTPRSKKIIALSVLTNSVSPASLQIIKQTLSSNDDEIRMYGYAIINQIEQSINSRINKNLKVVKNQEDFNKDEVANASKNLAFLYWELIYTNIPQESLKKNFIDLSIKYLTIAKEYYDKKIEELRSVLINMKEDISTPKASIRKIEKKLNDTYMICSSLYGHLGKIYIFQGKLDDAITQFIISKELLPENATSTIPYLAEVYYKIRKFNIVKSLFKHTPELRLNSKLYPIYSQWNTSK